MLFYHHFLASSGDYNSFYALKNERTVSLKREIEDMQTVLDSYWQRTAPAMHLATTVPGAIDVAVIGGGLLRAATCYW